ncbi:MAG: hypothetical protein PWP65_1615 [Clostridia bacterium]|nr:hypothetical protein [Clostridia bacterium]
MSSLDKKRTEFESGDLRYQGPNRVVFLAVIMLAVVGVTWFVIASRNTARIPLRWEAGTYNIGRPVSYKDNETINMVDVSNQAIGGNIILDLKAIVQKRLIYSTTPYEWNGVQKALTAYLTPSGNLVVAMSMCEPCRSQRFHITGKILICNTCGTRWLLADSRGLSGGCTQYPPERLPFSVKDGKILVPEKVVKEWVPRTLNTGMKQ